MTAMGQQLRSLSQPFRPVDDAAFVRAFERKMARYGKGSGADFRDVLNAGMAVLRDNGLRLDPALTLGMKAMTQASAFFVPLAPPDRPFTTAAVEVVLEQAQAPSTEVMVKEMLRKEATKVAGQAAHAAPEYLKSLVSWNNQLKKGKLTVSVDTSSLDSQMGQFRQIASMMMIAAAGLRRDHRLGDRRQRPAGQRQPDGGVRPVGLLRLADPRARCSWSSTPCACSGAVATAGARRRGTLSPGLTAPAGRLGWAHAGRRPRHPLPGRRCRPGGQGRELRRPASTPATRSSWPRRTGPRAPTS